MNCIMHSLAAVLIQKQRIDIPAKVVYHCVKAIPHPSGMWVAQSDFFQCVQIISAHTDVHVLMFERCDGITGKQGVRRERCGVALISVHKGEKQND